MNKTFILSGPFLTATKNELAVKIEAAGYTAVITQYRMAFARKHNFPLPDYVVSNQVSTPVKRKVKDAIEFGVPIISESQLLDMLANDN